MPGGKTGGEIVGELEKKHLHKGLQWKRYSLHGSLLGTRGGTRGGLRLMVGQGGVGGLGTRDFHKGLHSRALDPHHRLQEGAWGFHD